MAKTEFCLNYPSLTIYSQIKYDSFFTAASSARRQINNWFKSTLCFFFALIIISSLSHSAWSEEKSLSTSYTDQALSDKAIPLVISSHPRLFLRSTPWNHGPSLPELRELSLTESLKSYLDRNPWNPKPGLEWAFRYLLTQNEGLVPPIVQAMKTSSKYWPGYLADLATLYDWLYNSENFSAEDKKIVEDKIITWAQEAVKMGEEYGDMWSHFGYRPPLDIAAAGLALYGHRDEAKKYIALAGGYLRQNLLPGWQINDGAWQGGWAYYGQGCHNLFRLIALWSSATDEDLFEIIEKDHGDWIRNHLYYLIYTMYPDRTAMETCGFNWANQDGNDMGATISLLLLTRSYGDAQGIRHLNWRYSWGWWGWRSGIHQFLYYLPEFGTQPDKPYSLPLTKCWGRNGLGYVQMRSGWGEDDTIIDFKCGDYFWSHQFHNQNSFTIYRKGRLAIQSGAYVGSYFGPYMLNYYRPTISSNTILIIQPDEKTWVPSDAARRHGMETKNGYFPEYGGQRSCYLVPPYGSAETCFTLDKYLYRKNNQHHFETGTIRAFEVGDRYSYVYGDATMAYNNPTFTYPGNQPKIDLFTRQLLFLDKKYVVIFDRVNSLRPGYEKRWLLHSIGEPQFLAPAVTTESSGHLEVYDAGLVRIDHQDGTLFCQTLFPEDFLVRKVGGSATIGRVQADPTNGGDASLSGTIHGRYERVSSSLATDRARRENWVVEFVDADQYKIVGSLTGDDGPGSRLKDFLSKSQAIFIPKGNWAGVPHEGDKFTFSVISSSCRFWVHDRNVSPPPQSLINIIQNSSPIDPGNWRVEVMPKTSRCYDTFLHLLYPCDKDKASFPNAEGITTSESLMKGIAVDDWVVLFGDRSQANKPTSYSVKNTGTNVNLLLGLEAGSFYTVTIIKSGADQDVRRLAASTEGTILFHAVGPCRIELNPAPSTKGK